MTTNDGPNTLSTVERSTAIIERIREVNGAGVTQLAAHFELAPSTVHNHLRTLEGLEFLEKRGDVYHVGLRFLDLGGLAQTQRSEFDLAQEKVAELVESTGERAQYLVEEHGRGVYLSTMTGERAVQVNARIGRRTQIHASAAGKAILSTLPRERVTEIVDRRPLVALTDETITDRDVLFEELNQIREVGYAVNQQESVKGLRAVGVAVTDDTGRALGALSVSGPSDRLTGDRFDEELPELLQGASNDLELRIAYT